MMLNTPAPPPFSQSLHTQNQSDRKPTTPIVFTKQIDAKIHARTQRVSYPSEWSARLGVDSNRAGSPSANLELLKCKNFTHI